MKKARKICGPLWNGKILTLLEELVFYGLIEQDVFQFKF